MEFLTNDDIDFEKYLNETEAREKVRPAQEYLDAVMYRLYPAHEQIGQKIPFNGAFVDFRPGEVTLWAGYNGSGKSMLQGQVMGTFAENGIKCCIASFEMKPDVTLSRLCRQMLKTRTPTKEQVEGWLNKTAGNLWLYDQQGTVRPDRMIAVVKHCAEVLGCQHIAIDSLMKCVRGEDDYNGQKDFVDAITAAARDYNTHIHLVHHLRKGENEVRIPGKMDIKGTGAITDQVDNVLILWRNKRKERAIEEGETVDRFERDALLLCEKQRNGDWEGQTDLYYSSLSQRYSSKPEIL